MSDGEFITVYQIEMRAKCTNMNTLPMLIHLMEFDLNSYSNGVPIHHLATFPLCFMRLFC